MRSISLAAAAAAALSLLPGCSGDDGGGGGGSGYGGYVDLTHQSSDFFGDALFGDAEFYSSFQSSLNPLEGIEALIAPGECADLDTLEVTEEPEVEYADAGPSVTVSYGATTYTYSQDISTPPTIEYYDDGDLDFDSYVPNVDWDVTLAGGPDISAVTLTAALHTPAPLQLTAPVLSTSGEFSLPDAQDLALTYTTTGADELFIVIGDIFSLTAQVCNAGDGGTFTVPASVVSAVPASGQLFITASANRFESLEGRMLRLTGTSSVVAGYTKQ